MRLIIPTQLNEITVEQFIKYNRILNLKDIEADAMDMAIVSIFCNIPLEETFKISFKDLKDIVNQVTEVLQQEVKFTPTFDKYGFIPNFDKIGISEYIDLENYISDYENYHRAMAVMFRPITKKISGSYTIETYNGSDTHCNDMLNAPVTMLLGAMVFFWNLSSDLLKATNVYLSNNQTIQQELSEVTSGKNGDGIQALIQLLKEGELALRMQLN